MGCVVRGQWRAAQVPRVCLWTERNRSFKEQMAPMGGAKERQGTIGRLTLSTRRKAIEMRDPDNRPEKMGMTKREGEDEKQIGCEKK